MSSYKEEMDRITKIIEECSVVPMTEEDMKKIYTASLLRSSPKIGGALSGGLLGTSYKAPDLREVCNKLTKENEKLLSLVKDMFDTINAYNIPYAPYADAWIYELKKRIEEIVTNEKES